MHSIHRQLSKKVQSVHVGNQKEKTQLIYQIKIEYTVRTYSACTVSNCSIITINGENMVLFYM